MLSMLVRIPADNKPENTFEMMLPACQMPMRSGDSCLVYHELVMRDTAGRKGPSVTPTRKRQALADSVSRLIKMSVVIVSVCVTLYDRISQSI